MNPIIQAIETYDRLDTERWSALQDLREQLGPVVQLLPEWNKHWDIDSAELVGEVVLVTLRDRRDDETKNVKIPRAVIEADDPIAATAAHREAERQRALDLENRRKLREIEALQSRIDRMKAELTGDTP